MTCKEIIIEFLKTKYGLLIAYHLLDQELRDYGLKHHGKSYSTASYDRVFRMVKEDKDELAKNELALIEEPTAQKNYTFWRVKYIPINLFGEAIDG